jgi:hypothetical protein
MAIILGVLFGLTGSNPSRQLVGNDLNWRQIAIALTDQSSKSEIVFPIVGA